MEVKKYGADIMQIGEANLRISQFNGTRVQSVSDKCTGVVYDVYVNIATQVAQIWVNMDNASYARCFRPHHLIEINTRLPFTVLLENSFPE